MKKQQKKTQHSQPQAPQVESKGRVLYQIVGQFTHINILTSGDVGRKCSGPWHKNPSQPNPDLVHEITVRVLGKK